MHAHELAEIKAAIAEAFAEAHVHAFVDGLARVETKLGEIAWVLHVVRERLFLMGNQIDALISDLNTNTNAVSARLDAILAQLANAPTVSADQMASLQAISDHLKALGADPAQPVPTPPAAATASVVTG